MSPTRPARPALDDGIEWRCRTKPTDEPMSRTMTILPPPSDFPVPMPEPVEESSDSGSWRALVELTKETVRPGNAAAQEPTPSDP